MASKEKICKATLNLVSLNGVKPVIDTSGFFFLLQLLYFLFLPVRTSGGWGSLSGGVTHTFLKTDSSIILHFVWLL